MFRIRFNSIGKFYSFDILENAKMRTVINGSLETISTFSLNYIKQEQLTIAFRDLIENQDTVAEFGINGYFLFSKKVA